MSLRTKIVTFGVIQIVVLVGVLLWAFYSHTRTSTIDQYVRQARSVVLTTEATRERAAKLWDAGALSAEQLSTWAKAGNIGRIMASVPVVAAMEAAKSKATESGYEFRVPKVSPRNPKNTPDAIEARVLQMFERDAKLTEHHELDPARNAIRYFRPVRLTQECLLCHGDPAQSVTLWNNPDGMDPTGGKMENWKVGEVHGAFEIVQSLDAADQAIAAAMWRGAGVAGVLALLAAASFFWLVTRGVVRPVTRTVDGLNDGARQVNEAAAQVAQAGQSLAASASEQAASLQETSSGLEQMSAMTRQNAANAQQANKLASQAAERASSGDQTIGRLGTAMGAINESADQIGRIIKVIEEIAFQTNLLALNAAVEAARAGEHGKGFAVVAAEVRNLAQRATDAARETTGLIEAAVGRAKEGAEVAHAAGDVLRGIVKDVTQVAKLLHDVTRASEEQAQGVNQINTAVSEMDRLTQQNAAGAEESASSAEELSAQANTMLAMVSDLVQVVTGRTGRQ